MQPLNLEKIKKNLPHEKIGFYIFNCIDSTNKFLKTATGDRSIKICLAEQQTHGKGRLNRAWYSPYGQNIYFSCLYPFKKNMTELAGLSLVGSLAIHKTLENMGIKDRLFVKWPNDVVYVNKKISGSLIEIQTKQQGVNDAIIGIGINVNMLAHENHPISRTWTSMRMILDQYIDRNEVCISLINNLFGYLEQFTVQGLSPFITPWKERDCLMNQIITVNNLHKNMTGTVIGINDHGHLLLQLANGKVYDFSSGDTSIGVTT